MSNTTNDEDRLAILSVFEERLKNKKKELKCPLCGNDKFGASAYYTQKIGTIKKEEDPMNIDASLPSLSIICKNCGFIADLAIGTLGFFPKEKEKDETKKK